jgi:hypothetical protein
MSELPNKSDRQRRREARTLDLRERIRGNAYLRVLEGIAARADSLGEKEVSAYRLKADIYLRLLAKVLPDLKAIEYSGEITQRYVMELPIAAESTETWSQQSGHALQ